MAWYDIGTVSVTNGSATVTGSGTNFIAGAQIGEAFYGPDDRLYEIQAIVSATSLTLGSPYLGSTQTGQAYYIIPTQSLVASLASQVSTLISDFQSVADEAGEGKFNNGTAALPGITFNLDQDTGFSRPAANQIGFSTAGVQRALLSSTALTVNVPLTGTTGSFSGDATIHGATVGRGGGAVDSNVAFGPVALSTNTTGNQNTAIGRNALAGNISGNENTAVGSLALSGNTGAQNTAVGRLALQNNTTGSGNTVLGRGAGSDITTGNNNTIIGRIAGTAGLANTVIIGAGTQERMRINSAGNVGIGTSNPAFPLDVSTTGGIIARFTNGSSGGTPSTTHGELIVESGQANMGVQLLGTNASNQKILFGDVDSAGSGQIVYSHASDHMALHTSASERMRITNTGNVIVPAGITLGTAVGVYDAANTLDDYEEGTWTPVLTGAVTDPTYTHTSKYNKIGNLVTVKTEIVFTTAGTGQYNILTTSLPFIRDGNFVTGTVSVLDSGTSWYAGVARADNSAIVFYVSTHLLFSSTTPFIVASSDRLNMTMTYLSTQ